MKFTAKSKKDSESGTRTPVACVRGEHANHLHQFGFPCKISKLSKIIIHTYIQITTQSTILHKLNYYNTIHINKILISHYKSTINSLAFLKKKHGKYDNTLSYFTYSTCHFIKVINNIIFNNSYLLLGICIHYDIDFKYFIFIFLNYFSFLII